MTTTITPHQLKSLQSACNGKFRTREERLEAISEMVGAQVTSFNELTPLQADELIYFFNTGKSIDHSSWAIFDKYNTQHKAVLSLCYQLGWVSEENPKFVDLHRLGGWLKSNRSPVKRPLKEMTKQELSKIITALNNIINTRYR